MRALRSWVPALRVARRETVRGRGRSILVLVMIALPVLGVTAADVVTQTAEISGSEALERRLGTADALVQTQRGVGRVEQMPDPDTEGWGTAGGRGDGDEPDLDDLATALGRELRTVGLDQGSVRLETDAGIAHVEAVETDLTDDLTQGLYRIEDGRVAVGPDEVVINGALAERGFGLGDELVVRNGATLEVVGIGENTTYRGYPIAVSTPGAFDMRAYGSTRWLVDAGGDVTWADVRALNAVGAVVTSRAVLTDRPPASELPPNYAYSEGVDESWIAVVALVVVMALMEVVLLAGPAFAVIARRMQRSLALMAAGGATPQQARRVVLATGLVLGSLGSALGVGLGLLVARLSLPVVQRFSDSWLGPFDVPWLHLAGIAGFGMLSAFLAAVVPAWIASRQDVVAVLAGRRGEGRPSVRSPIVGVLLVATGVGVSVWGALEEVPLSIAIASVVTVLGMVLLVPVVVQLVSRLARHLPLSSRYAVRDAARHRTRTVPAVAAVAATVAGVVALGIAAASDEQQSEATYAQRLAMGQASLTSFGRGTDWVAYEEAARQFLPGADITPVVGVQDGARRWTEISYRVRETRNVLSMWSSWITSTPVSTDGTVPAVVPGLSEHERDEAGKVLDAGGVVVFSDQGVEGDEAVVTARTYRGGDDVRTRAVLPAYIVPVVAREATVSGVLSAQAADELGVEHETVGLVLAGASVSEKQAADVSEALAAIDEDVEFYVERGYQADDDYVIILLVLGSLGALLMLGGTLTATFLSISDAKPDLATLAAVGASPRTRRAVAASYALVIGVLGAVLGTLVGFVPGIAATYPLTGADWVQQSDPTLPSHFLDVPWLLIGSLVLALPLLTAAIVGVTTRSRLPLVARID